MSLRLALAQWQVGAPRSVEEFGARVASALDAAATAGAQIAVLPEYLALELAAAFPGAVQGDFLRSLQALQPLHETWIALFAAAARRHGMYVLAGTFLLRVGAERYRNRAYFFAPDGGVRHQDKLTLTGFERAAGVIEAGDALHVMDTVHGRVGIAVCYDSEFPLYARAQVEAGARLLLVPSCTDTAAGATRVRLGCRARALESQVFVAQAVTAGEAPWSPALDRNTGVAALYAPSDRGLPDDGVVAQAAPGEPWLHVDVDFGALTAAESAGQVANRRDWPAQERPAVRRARVLPD